MSASVLKYLLVTAIILVSAEGASAAVLTACGTLNQANTIYELQNDVSTTGTCFTIAATGVTLNLNGKKITYGTSSTQARYGIHIPNANAIGGVVLKNGVIEQGANAAAYSHAIAIFWGTASPSGVEITNITSTVRSLASVNIYSTEHRSLHIHGNVMNNLVTRVNNRHQLEGYAVKIIDGPGGHRIYGNTIVGGAQGGLYVTGAQNQIYNNDIRSGGGDIGYTNDFCIQGYGMRDSEIHHNYCHPVQGRGIFINGNNMKVYENTVDVIELSNNPEYGGCPLGGAYGIQLEGGATNSLVFNNTVTARADACSGKALRLTEIPAGANNRVYNNTFVAKRVGSGADIAAGISADAVTGGVTIEHNTFTADGMHFEADWEGATNLVIRSNRFIKGDNPASSYVTMYFANSAAAVGTKLIDGIFENGASASSARMNVIGFNDWGGAQEYFVQWTLTVLVRDSLGQPASQANVVIRDSKNQQVFSGQTDAQGKISSVLTEARRYNTTGAVNVSESFTPHVVTISKNGYPERTSTLSMNGTRELTLSLSGDPVPPAAPGSFRVD